MSGTAVANLVEQIGFGRGQIVAVCSGGGSWLADGSELLVLTCVTSALAIEWDLNMWQRSSIIAVVFLGVLVGNLSSGVIGDLMGRRFPILCSYVGIAIFSLLSVLAQGFFSMAFLRFCVGMSFGVAQPAFNALVGEITPSTHRMHVNAAGQLLFACGELYSGLLVWMQDPTMKDLSWRWLTGLGAIPAVIFFTIAYFVLTESPSFLMVKGRREEAVCCLTHLRDANGSDLTIDLPDPDEAMPGRQASETFVDKVDVLTSRHMRYTTFTLCMSCFTLNFIFYGCLYAFPQVLPSLELYLSPAMNMMLGVVFSFPAYGFAVVIGNYLPRKTMMMVYFSGEIVSCLALSFPGIFAGMGMANTKVILQLGFLGSKMFVSMLQLVLYVYVVEVYPTVVRATGAAVCLGSGRFGAMAAPMVYEKLSAMSGNFTAFFCFVAGLCAVNALMVLFLPFETKNSLLQDYPDEQAPLNIKNHIQVP